MAAESLRLEAFDLVSCIGEGSYGRRVYIAKMKTQYTMEHIVLKVQKKIAAHCEQLMAERNIALLTSEHAQSGFVAQHLFAFETETKICLGLKLYVGSSLAAHLRNCGEFEPEVSRFYIADIALGIEELHRLHILHDDIKLDNVLLDERGRAVINDFGLSQQLCAERQWRTGAIFKRKFNVAPEIAAEELYGFPADWYALGIIAKTLLLMQPLVQKRRECKQEKAQPEARRLVKALQRAEPAKRLNFASLKQHAFFRGFDWEKHEQRTESGPLQANCQAMKSLLEQCDDKKPLIVEGKRKIQHSNIGYSFISSNFKLKGGQ